MLKEQVGFIQTSNQYPNEVKKALIDGVAALFDDDFDVEKHFTPKYAPWRQRIADVPNMVWVMGYFRGSWTLRVDLIGDFICLLLTHMDQKQVKQLTMTLRDEDADMELLPLIDTEEFNPGYMLRSLHFCRDPYI